MTLSEPTSRASRPVSMLLTVFLRNKQPAGDLTLPRCGNSACVEKIAARTTPPARKQPLLIAAVPAARRGTYRSRRRAACGFCGQETRLPAQRLTQPYHIVPDGKV